MLPAERRGRVRAWLLAALLAGGCTAPRPAPAPAAPPAAPPAPAAQAAAPRFCQVGPDGGPVAVADRGIGGTGAPPAAPNPAAPAGRQRADRGIGGTGIIGVITGFASICVAGREVDYAAGLPVSIDGADAAPDALRAGQVAAVEATGPEQALSARRVLVQHEVIGPVQAREPGGALRVAGQRVVVTASALGEAAPEPGAWVAVSGLRDGDGAVQATRLDPASGPGAVLHGVVVREAGRFRIGAAELRPLPGIRLPVGTPVVVAGRWADGVLLVADARPDTVAAGPAAVFGPAIGIVVVESYAGVSGGRLVLSRRFEGRPGGPLRALVTLERGPGGMLRPLMEREGPGRFFPGGGGPGGGPGGRFGTDRFGAERPSRLEPAPIPNRSLDPARERPGGPRGGGGGRGQRQESGQGNGPGDGPGPGFNGPGFNGPGRAPR